jgi:hypothetical protein
MIRGIIYLIQPAVLVGTNKYKLGCSRSSTLNRCIKGYLKGSRYISIHECNDPLIVEKILIKKFKVLFKLVAGNEHFEGDESEMIMTIVKTIIKYKKIYNLKNDTLENNTSENDTSENDTLENNTLENNTLENNTSKNDTLENNTLENDTLENDTLENNTLENDTLENDTLKNDNFYCNECNRHYKSYKSLWNHNKTFHIKKPKIKEYICKVCNKSFDNKQNKYYHQKSCKNIQVISNKKYINNIPTIKTLKNPVKPSKTIIINNYKNDNLEYISDRFKDNLFKNLLNKEHYTILLPKLIDNIKFNLNYKENHNVKLKSIRSTIGFYYNQNKWKAINKNELLDELCDYSLHIFDKYFNEKKDTLSKDIIKNYHEFKQLAKLESELRIQIKKKIENIAYIFTLNNENELDD